MGMKHNGLKLEVLVSKLIYIDGNPHAGIVQQGDMPELVPVSYGGTLED